MNYLFVPARMIFSLGFFYFCTETRKHRRHFHTPTCIWWWYFFSWLDFGKGEMCRGNLSINRFNQNTFEHFCRFHRERLCPRVKFYIHRRANRERNCFDKKTLVEAINGTENGSRNDLGKGFSWRQRCDLGQRQLFIVPSLIWFVLLLFCSFVFLFFSVILFFCFSFFFFQDSRFKI